MPPRIRRATRDDASFLSWVMLAASRAQLQRGVWELIIGAGEPACLEYLSRLAVAEPRSLCHYESFWIAEAEGRPAAALSAFDMRTAGWAAAAGAMARVQNDLGWTDADRESSQQRAAPAWTCFLPEIGADWGIEHVATRPEFRRLGMSAALLDHAVSEGRAQGRKLAQITTFIGNAAAQSAYEKCGFRFADEKRSKEFASALQAPGLSRMIREL